MDIPHIIGIRGLFATITENDLTPPIDIKGCQHTGATPDIMGLRCYMVRTIEGTPDEVTSAISRMVSEQTRALAGRARATLIVEDATPAPSQPLSDEAFAMLMAEIQAESVTVSQMDDSREAMYTQMEGE